MPDQEKDDKGHFMRKSDSDRKIRSIRATDDTWNLLGNKAEENDMTRADFLEALATGQIEWEESEKEVESDLNFDVNEVAEILKDALKFKGNATKKIKAEIEKVLELMGIELDELEDDN
jgi:hypothetical protein